MATATRDKSHKDNSDCKRCGECCYYLHNGIKKKCKFLLKFQTSTPGRVGSTHCRIYKQNNRLYKVLDVNDDGTKITCNLRSDANEDFEGCVLNK